MTDDSSAKLRAAGFEAPPQSTLSSDSGLFALGGEQLAYLGAGGLQRVALREITRIHSDREGLLRVETLQGTSITASLIGFDPGAVQGFFNEVKVATNQAKNLPNSPQATPTGTSSWKSGWAVDPASRPAGEPAAPPTSLPPAATPASPPDATQTAPTGAQPERPQVEPLPVPATSAQPAAGATPAPSQPPASPPAASPARPTAAQAGPSRTAPPEPAEDEDFEESVTVLPRPPEAAEPASATPVELGKPTPAATAPSRPEPSRPEPSRPEPSRPAAVQATPVVISTAPSPTPRVSAQPAPAPREVSAAPVAGSAPAGELLQQAQAVARFAGTLRLLAVALGLAAVLVGVLRFRAGDTIDGLWTLGSGVVGAFALLVFAQVAQLLAGMAGAGQRGE